MRFVLSTLLWLALAASASAQGVVSSAPTGGFLQFDPPVATSGVYRFLTPGFPTVSGSAAVASRVFFVPLSVTEPITINGLGLRVTTAATGTFSYGIYADTPDVSGTGDMPTGSPLTEVDGVSSATAAILVQPVTNVITLQPGVKYWLAMICTGTASFQSVSAGNMPFAFTGSAVFPGYYMAGTGSTLPNPISGALTISPTAFAFLSN